MDKKEIEKYHNDEKVMREVKSILGRDSYQRTNCKNRKEQEVRTTSILSE